MSQAGPRPYDIAIIGAGFSGTMVAAHLADLAPESRVLVVERKGGFGPGVAYSPESPDQLLNVPAASWLAAQLAALNLRPLEKTETIRSAAAFPA